MSERHLENRGMDKVLIKVILLAMIGILALMVLIYRHGLLRTLTLNL
jgi:hypothetical protein